MEEEISYSIGKAPNTSWHIHFVNLNSNSVLPLVAETWDGIDIQDFEWYTVALGIKHTLWLYYYIQVNIKVNSYTMKAMDYNSDKRYSELSD